MSMTMCVIQRWYKIAKGGLISSPKLINQVSDCAVMPGQSV